MEKEPSAPPSASNSTEPLVFETPAVAAQPKNREKIDDQPEPERLRKNTLYGLCRPFLVVMRLGGLFFLHPNSLRDFLKVHVLPSTVEVSTLQNVDAVSRSNWSMELFERISMYYCGFAFLVIVTFCCRFIYGFSYIIYGLHFTQKDLGTIINGIGYLLWILELLLVHYIFVRACWKKNYMFRFFVSWENMRFPCPNPSTCRFNDFYDKFSRRRNIVCGFAVFHLICNIMSIWGPLLIPYEGYSPLKLNLMAGFNSDNTGVIFWSCLSGFYASFVFTMPSYFFLILAFVVAFDFYHLNHDLEMDCRKTSFPKGFEWYRLRHNTLCILLDIADEIFSPYILIVLGCGVLQILIGIFVLYAFSQVNQLPLMLALSQVLWILTHFLHIAMVLWMAAIVSENAHSPLLKMYQIDQGSLAIKESIQVQTFLSKLSCNRIGFTAWKMFNIEYSTILELFGMFVTYEILVFQLQLDLGLEEKVETHRCDCIEQAMHQQLEGAKTDNFSILNVIDNITKHVHGEL